MKCQEETGANCGGLETVRSQCVQSTLCKEEKQRGSCDAGTEGAWKERCSPKSVMAGRRGVEW